MRGLINLALLPLMATAAPSFKSDSIAPVFSTQDSAQVPNSYVVVFKKHVTEALAADHHSWVQMIHSEAETQRTELRKRSQSPINDVFSGLKHTYNIAGNFLGYSGHFDDNIIEEVRRHPDVDYVEKDYLVHTMENTDVEHERQAPWGLARISHRERLTFGNFNEYIFANRTGEGVDVYVIDTGINIEHVEFEGRASWGKTISRYDEDIDGNGHGTHCSGTIAGKKYGVAKMANVIAVKVLGTNGSGSMSDVVKGIDWAAKSHLKNVRDRKKGFKGSVANMSLGGGKSQALDHAVNGAVMAGMHFAVAAGNDNSDSCKYSPAAAELAVTVGATTLDDSRAYFSNYGTCNDVFAPGLSIKSAWIGSKNAVNTISGTSMASPHIAGLLAYYLSLQPELDSDYAVPSMTPKKMKEVLVSVGTKGAIKDLPSNTANVLAWNGGGSANLSSIIDSDSYSVPESDENLSTSDLSMPSTVQLLKEEIEKNIEAIDGEFKHDIDALVVTADVISTKVFNIFEQESDSPCEGMEM
ncbi:Alkaline protease 2 [Golovinomyces cichoracearum]|uniref:Alkaline protease 2 n=1 Tax=Golovinomyces cichoracearum TaxID=62708 RepID=A0A420I9S3_9PEZI|nr:Alkaline protease 2 [Golovinomyces cichoracearum]